MADPTVKAAVCSPKPEDRQQEIDETAKMSVDHAQPPSPDPLASRSEFTTGERITSSEGDAATLARQAACFAAEAPRKITSDRPANPMKAAEQLGIDPALVIGNWDQINKQSFRPTGLELIAATRDTKTKRITHFKKGPFQVQFSYETKSVLKDGKVSGTYTMLTGVNATYENQKITAQAIELKDGSYLVALEGIWRGELLHLFGPNLDRLVELSPREMRQRILEACRTNNRGAIIPSIDEQGRRDSFRDPAHKSQVQTAIFAQLGKNLKTSKVTPVTAAPAQSKAEGASPKPAPEGPPKKAPTVAARVISDGGIVPITETVPLPIKLQSSEGEIDATLQLISAKIVDKTKPRDEQEVEETYHLSAESDGETPPKFVHQFDFTVRRKAINYIGGERTFRLNHNRQPVGITYQSSEMDALSPTVTLDRNAEYFLIQTVSGERTSTISLPPSYLMVLATRGAIPKGFPEIILEGNLPITVKTKPEETKEGESTPPAPIKPEVAATTERSAPLTALDELKKRTLLRTNTNLFPVTIKWGDEEEKNAGIQLDDAILDSSSLNPEEWTVKETYALYLGKEGIPILFEVERKAFQRNGGQLLVNRRYQTEGAIDAFTNPDEEVGIAVGFRAATVRLNLRGGILTVPVTALTQLSSNGKLEKGRSTFTYIDVPKELKPAVEVEHPLSMEEIIPVRRTAPQEISIEVAEGEACVAKKATLQLDSSEPNPLYQSKARTNWEIETHYTLAVEGGPTFQFTLTRNALYIRSHNGKPVEIPNMKATPNGRAATYTYRDGDDPQQAILRRAIEGDLKITYEGKVITLRSEHFTNLATYGEVNPDTRTRRTSKDSKVVSESGKEINREEIIPHERTELIPIDLIDSEGKEIHGSIQLQSAEITNPEASLEKQLVEETYFLSVDGGDQFTVTTRRFAIQIRNNEIIQNQNRRAIGVSYQNLRLPSLSFAATIENRAKIFEITIRAKGRVSTVHIPPSYFTKLSTDGDIPAQSTIKIAGELPGHEIRVREEARKAEAEAKDLAEKKREELKEKAIPYSETDLYPVVIETVGGLKKGKIQLVSAEPINFSAAVETDWMVKETYLLYLGGEEKPVVIKLERKALRPNHLVRGLGMNHHYKMQTGEAYDTSLDPTQSIKLNHTPRAQLNPSFLFPLRDGQLSIPVSLFTELSGNGKLGDSQKALKHSGQLPIVEPISTPTPARSDSPAIDSPVNEGFLERVGKAVYGLASKLAGEMLKIELIPHEKTAPVPIVIKLGNGVVRSASIQLESASIIDPNAPFKDLQVKETYALYFEGEDNPIRFEVRRNAVQYRPELERFVINHHYRAESGYDATLDVPAALIAGPRGNSFQLQLRDGFLTIPTPALTQLSSQGQLDQGFEEFNHSGTLPINLLPIRETDFQKIGLESSNQQTEQREIRLASVELFNTENKPFTEWMVEETYIIRNPLDGTAVEFKLSRNLTESYQNASSGGLRVSRNFHEISEEAICYREGKREKTEEAIYFGMDGTNTRFFIERDGRTLQIPRALLTNLATEGNPGGQILREIVDPERIKAETTVQRFVKAAEKEFKAEIEEEIRNKENKISVRIEKALSLMKGHPYNPAFKALVLAIEDMYSSDQGTRNKILYELFGAYTKSSFIPMSLEDPRQSEEIDRLGTVALEKVYLEQEVREQKLTDLKMAAERKEEETREEWKREFEKLMKDGK